MELQVLIKMNDKLFMRDPESTELGRKIVRQAIVIIDEIGFEQFTFKKLAQQINTTEAGIYRYFENKHRLLVYILAWYWSLLEYQVIFHLNNVKDPEQKLKKVVALLSSHADEIAVGSNIDLKALFNIAVSESNKAYLTKEVTSDNKAQFFKPYKDLCKRIASLILDLNPAYAYPHSLASTLVETAHLQHFFKNNLPSLTDFEKKDTAEELQHFLEVLLFSNLKPGTKV